MDGASTDSLRALAPKWSLAGDDQLLNLLQNTHQRIISKCQDVNSKLEEMASALDGASIDLQNVNNKFMALSNTQFIESRVYDDDELLTSEAQPAKEASQPSPVDELSLLKNSLAILERAHETTEIMDDSDSDSDTEIRVVLKPKDMYSHRPLPYIIGTQNWRNKWHAGLVVEDSDSDSTTSKQDHRDLEQYSDSESEGEVPRPRLEDRTISETSSSLTSSQAIEASPAISQRPSDIAAELARRLGGPTQILDQEPEEYIPPVPTTRKVYKPEQPATSTIFSDEPPPLDSYEQDESEEDDIFAELDKNKPFKQRSAVQNNLADDLFSFNKPEVDQGDIFSDFAASNVETKSSAKQKTILFEEESEPELFAAQPHNKEIIQNNNIIEKQTETNTKKPVGGISLFGSNKGAESIGAAILKRNRRKSSTSGDESGCDNIQRITEEKPKIVPKSVGKTEIIPKSKAIDEPDNFPTKEKDIFDDLFAKSEKETKPVQKIVKETVKDKEKKPVKDLFSDNIFDDIDDIFTSNVIIPPKKSNQKSIFDDDDLFSDIAKPVSSVNQTTDNKNDEKTNTNKKKSIFDSDDELFSDIKTTENNTSSNKNTASHANKIIKDNSTEIFKESKGNYIRETIAKVDDIVKSTETTKERNLFDDSPQKVQKTEIKPVKASVKSKGIFDSDSDEDIFANMKITDDKKPNKTENVLKSNTNNSKPADREDLFEPDINSKLLKTEDLKPKGKANVIQSPSLFEEDEIDDLFMNTNKLDTVSNVTQETKPVQVEDIPKQKDTKLKKEITTVNENKALSIADTKKNNEPDTIVTEKSATIPSQDIFDDNILENNLFASSNESKIVANQNVADKTNTPDVIKSSPEVRESTIEESNDASYSENEQTESQFGGSETVDVNKAEVIETKQESRYLDENQSVFDDFIDPVKEKRDLMTDQKKTISNEPNIFDNIFTEPPAFEKPAESKKSKNVNALFDDDSDDESLFFKKNDVISDEKPEIFTNNANANFDIFVDEPPAVDVDVDFTTNPTNDIDFNDDDIFSSVPKMKESVLKSTKNADVSDSVPKIQENVPDNNIAETNVTNINTDKPNITHKVSETKLENSFPTKYVDKAEIENTNTDTTKSHEKIINTLIKGSDSDDELFSSLPKPNSSKSSQNHERSEQNESLKSNVVEKNKSADEFDDIFSKNSPKRDTDRKKIGKLNTKSFNINVDALMPGASPKKVPKEKKDEQNIFNIESENASKIVKLFPTSDEIDFQPKSLINTVENEEKEKTKVETDLKGAKSIAFEEKPESEVLDNNLSKQRARIQVKRRPSSRRARHEAARKSAIDFDDETDNSSSLDNPVKAKKQNDIENIDEPLKSNNIIEKDGQVKSIQKDLDIEKVSQIIKQNTQKESNTTQVTASETPLKTSTIEEILPLDCHKNNVYQKVAQQSSDLNEIETESRQDIKQNLNEQNSSTTKVVYILNDEDIFNTGSKNMGTKSDSDIFGTKNVETKADNDIFATKNVGTKVGNEIFATKNLETKSVDDIFKSIDGVNTLGKAYKENTKETNKVIKKDIKTTKLTPDVIKNDENTVTSDVKSSQNAKSPLFDDSDEELFNKNKKVVKKTTIFDSDSEEDLFTGKKRTEKQNKEQRNREVKERKEVNVKGSLFGDDDDDDLFGLKKEKSAERIVQPLKPSSSKETAIASKSVESVFDDPLSMLGDD